MLSEPVLVVTTIARLRRPRDAANSGLVLTRGLLRAPRAAQPNVGQTRGLP